MKALFMKEIRLAMHPTAPLFLGLSAMLLIPNYPYGVVFFYTALAVFFTCLSGRENQDVMFTMLLPVAKRDVVRARMALVLLLEGAQLLAAIPCAMLRSTMIAAPNMAGMDANTALFGLALMELALFNLVFFPAYYRDVRKIGAAFIKGSTAVFGFILLEEAAVHTAPWVRDVLDTPDPQHLPQKLTVLAVGAAMFTVLTLLARALSIRRFERMDL